MMTTTDPRLLAAALANFDPSDGAPQDPQSPGESPGGGGGGSLSLSDSHDTATGPVAPALLCPLCETNEHPATQCPQVAAEKARQARAEAAGRGIARQMRHDRARFLRCVARVGASDRTAMAGALEFYLTVQTRRIFTSAPVSADRILALWAAESAALVS
jgi:hypothetical protein